MSEKIVQLNEEVIKGQIKELVHGSVEETLSELPEKEAESLTQAPATSAGRPVRATAAATMTQPHHDLRRCHAPYAPPQGRVLRDCHHRAVSPPGEQRRGSAHRNVSGRRFRAPCGGHHRGAVGQQGFSRHYQRAEQESLCFTLRTGAIVPCRASSTPMSL